MSWVSSDALSMSMSQRGGRGVERECSVAEKLLVFAIGQSCCALMVVWSQRSFFCWLGSGSEDLQGSGTQVWMPEIRARVPPPLPVQFLTSLPLSWRRGCNLGGENNSVPFCKVGPWVGSWEKMQMSCHCTWTPMVPKRWTPFPFSWMTTNNF